MEEKIVELFSEGCANFVCSVFIICGVGFMLELGGAVVSVWKKILSK